MFTAPLRSKERGADHRKYRFYIVARVRFCGNVITEPLPSNELFRFSGIVSHFVMETRYVFLEARTEFLNVV
jgi:hypothetical protein